MKKCVPAAVLTGCLVCSAHAETTTNTVDAARIVVTATRSAHDIRTVPGNPVVITSQEIESGRYTSIPDVLTKKAGLFFRRYSDNPSQSMIDMRGFGDNSHGRVLVLVDGRRLNEADMAALNWSAVPLNAVERIEVLSGPAATLYGDNAVGGVINIITKKGSDEPLFSLGASAGSHKTFEQNAAASGRTGELGYTAAVNHQSGDGYRDRSRYDNLSIYTGLDFMPNEFFSGTAGFSVVDRQYQLPGSLSTAQKRADRRQSNELSDVRDTQYNIQAGAVFTPDEAGTLSLDLGYRRMDQFADLNREFGPWGTYYDAFKDTWTVEPRYILTLPAGNAVNETTVGIDWRSETILIDRFTAPDRSVQSADAKVEQQTLDFYLNNRLFVMDDKLILHAGGRSGQSRIQVKDVDITGGGGLLYDESKTRGENAFSFGITALPLENLKLYAKFDEFYRFPFTDEQALYFGSVWVDAFTDLQPEKGKNYELGGAVSPTENSEISLAVYRMEMKNEIRYNPGSFANENLPETLHQGVDLSVTYEPCALLRLGFIYSYTEAKFDGGPDKGRRIPGVPLDRFRASADLRPLEGLTLSTGITYTGRMHAINDNGNNGVMQGGFTLVDFLASYTGRLKRCDWNVFAGVDNLFGKEYDYWRVSNAAGTVMNHYPAPERTYKAGFGVTF